MKHNSSSLTPNPEPAAARRPVVPSSSLPSATHPRALAPGPTEAHRLNLLKPQRNELNSRAEFIIYRRMTSSTDSGPKKRKRSKSISKSSGFLMFPRPFRILALCKRCRRLRQSHVSPRQKSQYTGGSQSPSSSEKGPLVPCGTNQQRSINLNEKQMKEALLSARYALNKYSATEDTNVVFGKLLSASATLDKEEECNSYSMTIEASDKRLYDAHVLYKMGKEEMFECFFIRPTNSCS